jgi:hypothetical protein
MDPNVNKLQLLVSFLRYTSENLVAIAVKTAAETPSLYYVHPDHLGSLMIITDAAGTIKQKCSFDSWQANIRNEGSVPGVRPRFHGS